MTPSAHTTIQAMYAAINRRDVPAAMALVDDNCLYQDLNFPQPFRGKAAVQQLFEEFCTELPADLQFVIDDITTGDSSRVGILWHLELAGVPFPNGRGVSFCRLSETTGKLIFGRDLVEPPLKPGKVAFFIIRLVMPLARQLLKSQATENAENNSASVLTGPHDITSDGPPQPPSQNDRSNLVEDDQARRQPWIAALLWLLSAAYIYILFLSPPGQIVPGEPVWALRPETIQHVLDESINFFFILPAINAAGVHVMEAPNLHPVLEGLFNLAEAWIFMFLPLLLADRRERKLSRVTVWGLAMFLTNAIMGPYMALRANAPLTVQTDVLPKGGLARIFGLTGLVVGSTALVWFFVGRPEFGGLAERLRYFGEQVLTNRLTLAFCVDLVLFSLFQAVLLGAVEPLGSPRRWLRFVPFWGLVAWLIL